MIKNAIEDKRDQLIVLAISSCKSLCEFPALFVKSGITIVISPLISFINGLILLFFGAQKINKLIFF